METIIASLDRIWKLSKCTIGKFYFDGLQVCYMLEDKKREPGVKVANETAIPSDLEYFIGRVHSPRFKRVVPVIYTEIVGKGDTPDDYVIKDAYGNVWKCVEIHPGNDDTDTDACQLPGTGIDLSGQRVTASVPACGKVNKLIFDVLDAGKKIRYVIREI